MQSFHLVVREPFGAFAKGDRIEDGVQVQEILESDHEHHVIRVAAPSVTDAPEPVAAATPAPEHDGEH